MHHQFKEHLLFRGTKALLSSQSRDEIRLEAMLLSQIVGVKIAASKKDKIDV